MIQIWINDPRSLGSWCIKGTNESALGKDLSVPLMRHDPSDLGSLIEIQIIPKECTLFQDPVKITKVSLAVQDELKFITNNNIK